MILEAEGEATALERVFQAVHANDADPKVLAYKYLEMLPRLAEHGNGYFVIPGELTEAVKTVASAFAAGRDVGDAGEDAAPADVDTSAGALGPVPQQPTRSTATQRDVEVARAAADEAGAEAQQVKRTAPIE